MKSFCCTTLAIVFGLLLFSSCLAHEQSWRGLYSEAKELEHQGKWSEAIVPAKQSLRAAQHRFGRDSIYAAKSLNLLADLHRVRGNYSEAAMLYGRVGTIHEKMFGPRHINTTRLIVARADVCALQGKASEAKLLYSSAIQRAGTGKSVCVAGAMMGLAGLYQAEGRYDRSEELYEKALNTYEVLASHQRPLALRAAETACSLASLYRAKGDYRRAVKFFKKAVDKYENAGSSGVLFVADTMLRLGDTYAMWKKPVLAQNCYEKALGIQEKVVGTNNFMVAVTLKKLADLNAKKGNNLQAERMYAKAVSVLARCSGSGCPLLAATLKSLSDMKYAQGRHAEASAHYKRLLAAH